VAVAILDTSCLVQWNINKRRDFQNDALIALTSRRHGATVVTANSSDFELLRAALRISVLPAK
jgi:predicted nucleic acid-binding protein